MRTSCEEAMSDTICEATVTPATNPGKPARSSKRPPTPIRPTRLQIEQLENRDVMTAVLDVPVAETASSVMQASCMSAFFQQSSLFDNGQPATFPTVTWTTRDDQKREEPIHAQQMEAPERLTDRFEQESNELPRGLRGPQNSPNQSSRSTGGLRKLLRADGAWPSHVFAPYVDMSALPTYDLIDAAESQGLLYFNLSSITAGSQNRPSWGGDNARAIDGGPFDTALRQQITKLRALGGDVAVSFGGAKGAELAQAISSVEDLRNAYREVVDAYGLQRIDFDLSANALNDAASVERRSMAVSELQRDLAATGHKLHVWMTLPATRSGLSDAALQAVQSAQRHGVELDGVNLKTTDDGNETAPGRNRGPAGSQSRPRSMRSMNCAA